MATLWRGIWIAAALLGCQPSQHRDSLDPDHHKSLRYPEHRKIEEHRIEVLEANTARLEALERQVSTLQGTVQSLERSLAEQKAAATPPVQP